jgi:hypothetical protein
MNMKLGGVRLAPQEYHDVTVDVEGAKPGRPVLLAPVYSLTECIDKTWDGLTWIAWCISEGKVKARILNPSFFQANPFPTEFRATVL